MFIAENQIPSPQEIAALWRNAEGFAWLDSSSNEADSLSILGHHPTFILEGSADETSLLAAELECRKHTDCSLGLEAGAAIGYFRFDGSFRFGFYDTLLIHSSTGWRGNLPAEATVQKEEKLQEYAVLDFKPDLERSQYLRMVERAQEYIAAGDIYQVCLSHRFEAEYAGDPWTLYLALRRASPAPHAAYLHLSAEETVLSSSPECFLKIDGRHILTCPIKGTRPRMASPELDAQQAVELASSSKEIAELIMITDLERNDLGSICDYGSVSVTQLLSLKSYAQVFHLVSTIEGTLRSEISHVEALAACFPGGSISGAPKKRALEIIHELEPSPRGLFTGAIGYFGYNGQSQFNIAIRTAVIDRRGDGKRVAEFHVGAGITAGSNPKNEWEETLHKAAGILKAARASGGI